MRKTIKTLLCIIMAIATVGLVACGGGEEKECNHVYDKKGEVLAQATCTNKGTQEMLCKCGEKKVEYIPALGHDIEQVQAKAATCTEFGWNAHEKCKRTGCEYSTYEAINAKGHDYENGKCKVEGCEAIEPNHQHNYTATVTTAPDCTKTGVRTHTCSICGDSYTESIPANGHKYENGVCECGVKLVLEIKYYLVEKGKDKDTGEMVVKEVYDLEEYKVMRQTAGNYPTYVNVGKVTISSLKTGAVEVESKNKYSKDMTFKGWYADEACETLLGKGDIEIDVSSNISVYALVEVAEWYGPY